MRLIIVRHGETDWTLSGRYTDGPDVALTDNGRQQAASLPPLREHRLGVDQLVAEYDYGDYEGLTGEQIHRQEPGWDIWRDGCPDGESTADVGARADAFLHATVQNCPRPLIVVTHGHFSRILAARTLGLAPEYGRLFASVPASVCLIEAHDGERWVGLWNATVTVPEHPAGAPSHSEQDGLSASPQLVAGSRSS